MAKFTDPHVAITTGPDKFSVMVSLFDGKEIAFKTKDIDGKEAEFTGRIVKIQLPTGKKPLRELDGELRVRIGENEREYYRRFNYDIKSRTGRLYEEWAGH